MSPRRGFLFILCVLGLCALALFVGESARAEGVTWKSFHQLEVKPTVANDACPSGAIRFVPGIGKNENLLVIGAVFSFSWTDAAAPQVEQTACRTTTTTKATNSSLTATEVDDKCQDASQNGKRVETLRIVDARTMDYRREMFDAKGKSAGKVRCTLKVVPVSK